MQDLIQARASLSAGGAEANIIWGAGPSSDLKDGEIELTVVATGFEPIGRKELPTSEEGGEKRRSTLPPLEEEESAVKWNITERYKDIDNMLLQPAYFRRGLQLTGSSRNVKAHASDMIAESGATEEKAPQAEERTLF